jgi:hypothetical protein
MWQTNLITKHNIQFSTCSIISHETTQIYTFNIVVYNGNMEANWQTDKQLSSKFWYFVYRAC